MADPRRQEELIDQLTTPAPAVEPAEGQEEQPQQQRARVSVRRCCRVLGHRRATYTARKAGHRPEERDKALAKVLRATAEEHIGWGFWKIFNYLRYHQIITDNHKRVYRVWKEEGLNLRPSPKRRRIYREYQELLSPDGINEGWAMDFVSDWVVGPTRKSVRIINIMDEGSRRALWTEAHESISAKKLMKSSIK